MQIFVDADACPVVAIVEKIAFVLFLDIGPHLRYLSQNF